jgi:predicted esterase
MSNAKKPKLKILMIHGYRQNESAFRERTGGLRKSLKNYVDFVFCESPLEVPKFSCQLEDETKENDKGWWFSASDSSYNALDKTDVDLGFEQSLEYLNSVFESQGPFDAILGFSQGGCLASILCRLSETQSEKYESIRFKFAIIVAGFRSNQSLHDLYYDLSIKVKMPTLHIYGETDKVIPIEMSEELTNYFEDAKIFKHAGGHLLPVNAEAKNNFIDFINQLKSNI